MTLVDNLELADRCMIMAAMSFILHLFVSLFSDKMAKFRA